MAIWFHNGVSGYLLHRVQKVQNAETGLITRTKRRKNITPVRAACEDMHSI